jgi:hypothetical protein
MENKKYSFSMSVLYQVLRIVLVNAAKNIVALGTFKSKYNDAYINDLQIEVDKAERMKSEQARNAEHELLREQLVSLGDDCRGFWQDLKRYIAEAYGTAVEAVQWDAAGWQNYDAASHDNWDKLREMMSMGSLFIEENLVKLTTDGFMPADFRDKFEASRSSFNDMYMSFDVAMENALQGTVDKILANNSIYDKIVQLCLDGQTVFKKDDTKKALFSMEAVSQLVKPVGAATVVFEVTNSETLQAQPGVEIVNMDTERSIVTDANGRAEMGQQASGSTNYKIVADGFPEEIITVDVQTGTKSIQKITITPLIGVAARAEIASTAVAVPVN